jgi:hypothetical protein
MRFASLFAFFCIANDAMLATPLLGFAKAVQRRVSPASAGACVANET